MRIGIDIGGTKISAGVVDQGGRLLHKEKIELGRNKAYGGAKDRIIRLVETVLDHYAASTKELELIGVACAGQIDKDRRTVLFSPNLGWHNVPLKDDIERRLKVPTILENDANAAAYGEWMFGLEEKTDNLLGIFVGTGVGGGLILNGSLCRGFANVGGEVGHITVDPRGYRCNCGNTGCFEAHCGGSYVVERIRRRIREGYRGKIGDLVAGNLEALHMGHIEEAYLMGDEVCGEEWRRMIQCFGAALASLVNLLNPEIIVLGGGVINGTRYLLDDVRKIMEKRAMAASWQGVRMQKAQLGEDAAIVGAAFMEN
jgi:glucokinase